MDKSKRNTYITAGAVFVILLIGIYFLFIFKKGPSLIKQQEADSSDIKQIDQVELDKRPYVTLTPTADGAEIIISITNMAEFDKIEYELTYQADNPTSPGTKIQRGATGTDVNTKDAKYKKAMLLGTASRGVRNPDTGVADGLLLLHMFKGDTQYDSETPWDMVQVGAIATTISDRSENITLALPALGKNYWIILADTLGIPPGGSFDVEKVSLPIYGAFSIAPAFKSPATLNIKSDQENPDLWAYSLQDAKWGKLSSKSAGNNIEAKIDSFATFVVSSSK